MGGVVQFTFAFTRKDPGEELQARVVVGGEWHGADARAAGEAPVDDGLSGGLGADHGSAHQAGAQDGQAVVDAVDLGDDVELAAVSGTVPAAQEVGDQACGRGQQRDGGQSVLADGADGQFVFGEVRDQGQVLAVPFDDVVGVEGGVRVQV